MRANCAIAASLAGFAVFLLTSCGLKGDLYLPDNKAAAQGSPAAAADIASTSEAEMENAGTDDPAAPTEPLVEQELNEVRQGSADETEASKTTDASEEEEDENSPATAPAP